MTTTRGRTALVVRGGWDGHVPVPATDLFIPHLREHGFDVRVEESTEVYADADYLADVDLIMQCVTMSTIEQDQLTGLRTAVEAGTGFAGWHGGIADSFRGSSDYLHLVGGQFACHPAEDGKSFVPHTITITMPDHPIVAGIEDFELITEQYWMLSDDYLDVLATTTQRVRPGDPWHREVTSPAIWTRQWGAGRIFVATPGHDLETLQHPSVGEIIRRGLLWAAR